MIGKEKERSKTKAVQTYNFRGLLGIRRMDKVQNVRIRGWTKGSMENDKIAQRVYIGECEGCRSLGRLRKR